MVPIGLLSEGQNLTQLREKFNQPELVFRSIRQSIPYTYCNSRRNLRGDL